jgi:hypothetical protein
VNATTAEARALRHAPHLGGEDRQLFVLGFHAGWNAEKADANTERVLAQLIDCGNTAQAAGYLEGCVAARDGQLRPTPRWRNDRRARREAA